MAAMESVWAGIFAALVAIACTGAPVAQVPPTTDLPSPTATPVPASTSPSDTDSPGGAFPSPTAIPAPGVAPLAPMDVERAFPNLSFREMLAMAYPDDGTDRLFLALKPGRIVVFPNDQSVDSAATFLDITGRVSDRGSEEGLLGLTFDPEYSRNGYLYVYYSAAQPRRVVVSRFSVSSDSAGAADPSSERVILEIPQPFANHNGGPVKFGPDGFLYIGLGDGGGGGDRGGNGQNTSTLLSTILRIHVRSMDSQGAYTVPADNPFVGLGGGAREEIWAYGLRNPWRFTFDRETGDLWLADVGQNRFEEVDLIRRGLNYGWNVMEGTHCFAPSSGCDRTGLQLPIIEYGHREGCSVTGGYVYRGSRLPMLSGAYVYGDFCSGKIWGLRYDGTEVSEHLELADTGLNISSFGEDQSGELYILAFDSSGDAGIYRLMPR